MFSACFIHDQDVRVASINEGTWDEFMQEWAFLNHFCWWLYIYETVCMSIWIFLLFESFIYLLIIFFIKVNATCIWIFFWIIILNFNSISILWSASSWFYFGFLLFSHYSCPIPFRMLYKLSKIHALKFMVIYNFTIIFIPSHQYVWLFKSY